MSEGARPTPLAPDQTYASGDSADAATLERGRTQPPQLDLRPIETLLARIKEMYRAEQVWLFGSRARGDADPWSDWDVFVVVPDETDERDLDPLVAWRLQRGSGVHADVIPCRATDFRNACDTVNTLSYVVAREGVLIYDR
jgi:uncharacterized protein